MSSKIMKARFVEVATQTPRFDKLPSLLLKHKKPYSKSLKYSLAAFLFSELKYVFF